MLDSGPSHLKTPIFIFVMKAFSATLARLSSESTHTASERVLLFITS